MVNENLYNVIDELTEIGQNAELAFGDLSGEQINWRPSADGWSVGQCLEHLIKSNELFYGELDRIADGTRKNSLLESYSPLSGVFANLLVGSLKKDTRKFKVPTKKIAPPSDVDQNIVEIFAAHQAELIGKIKRTENADWRKIKITSPFLKIATYSLTNGFQIIIEHEKRHIRQAARVTQADGFPQK